MAKMMQDHAAYAMSARRRTIAVVDDDPSILKAIGRLLITYGYRIEQFDSAEAFFKQAATSKADCLLLDCQLGESSGLELRRRLSATGFEIPTIFMTGSDSEEFRKEAVASGCVGFLRKPFDERHLRELIAKAIVASSLSKKG